MTDSEIYAACKDYSSLRAKPGCASNKSYWVAELRTRIAKINHEIIMARGAMGKGERTPELQAAYDDLRAGYETAIGNVYQPATPANLEPNRVAKQKTLPGGLQACPDCGSTELSWDTTVVNKTGAPQGRLRTNEVGGVFYLGCDHCSATVWVIDSSEVAKFLNTCRQKLYP